MSAPLRFLHIDAGHEYHEVLEQLELFTPLLSDHGIIAMDDYQDREFPGIEAAVLDFTERRQATSIRSFFSGRKQNVPLRRTVGLGVSEDIVSQSNFKDACRLTRVRDFNVLVLRSKLPVPSAVISKQLDSFRFPRRSEKHLTLNQKSDAFSQLNFGSGQSSTPD